MINVKTEKFEGPLGLLLQLIEKEELDIAEVSLAKIADQYVDYIKSFENIGPEEMADFLVVAAKLLLIKSKALLPYLYTGEEEEDIKEFEEQLRMYKEFIEATKGIELLVGKRKFMFAREFNRKAILENAQIFSPPKNLEAEELKTVIKGILLRIKPIESELKEEKLEHKISLEEKILSLQGLVLNKIRLSFKKIIYDSSSKTEIIVTFLAMLELAKQRRVLVEQSDIFGDILISGHG